MEQGKAPKHRQHIRPLKAGDQTVCVLSGRGALTDSRNSAEGSRTSRVNAVIACVVCRVGADLMLETGDLFVNAEGRWELDDRPEEFRSINHFIAYLGEDERRTFTLDELQSLVRHTKASFKETRDELRRLGFRMEQPPAQREVRGIGRLKPAHRDPRD